MLVIFQKEVRQFFSSLVGYMAIIVFLLLLGLVVWVFPDVNVFDNRYATLDGFFYYSPLIMCILIPAICMRSFAEEIKTGTYELLATRPVTELQIILGKYLATLFLIFLSILPTLLYFYTISVLASPAGNVDTGGIIGSYIGLFLIGAVFAAIGIFCSAISANEIVAFILALFLCLFLYTAFAYMSHFDFIAGKNDYAVESIGLAAHYDAMSRGVIDSRDVVYFFSFIALFILLTRTSLSSRKW
jgi:ABC-2 type transport system permease protein